MLPLITVLKVHFHIHERCIFWPFEPHPLAIMFFFIGLFLIRPFFPSATRIDFVDVE
jgi:hypothetical protein